MTRRNAAQMLAITACALWVSAPALADSTAPGAVRTAAVSSTSSEEGASSLQTVLVTARLRQEDAQNVPISLSVVDASTLEVTRTDNIAQVSQLVPSLNYTSPNPRNTAF